MTTIQRQRDLLVPDGNTVLEAGDELVIIGPTTEIDAIRALVAGPVHGPAVDPAAASGDWLPQG